MRLSPTPMSDPMQRRIFMFMPLFITAVCYNFPSGLTLYWTVQNCFTIFQQWVTNRSKDPVPVQSEKKTLAAPRVAPVKVKSKKR